MTSIFLLSHVYTVYTYCIYVRNQVSRFHTNFLIQASLFQLLPRSHNSLPFLHISNFLNPSSTQPPNLCVHTCTETHTYTYTGCASHNSGPFKRGYTTEYGCTQMIPYTIHTHTHTHTLLLLLLVSLPRRA